MTGESEEAGEDEMRTAAISLEERDRSCLSSHLALTPSPEIIPNPDSESDLSIPTLMGNSSLSPKSKFFLQRRANNNTKKENQASVFVEKQ